LIDRARFSGKRALVVDDQAMVHSIARSMLRSMGFEEVRIANDGLEAIAILAEHRVDVIICDHSMPYMSGIDLVGAIRTGQAYTNPNTPIIMLTGHADTQNVEAAGWLKVQGFLGKPVSLEELTKRIAYALDNPPAMSGLSIDPKMVTRRIQTAHIEKMKAEAEPKPSMSQQELERVMGMVIGKDKDPTGGVKKVSAAELKLGDLIVEDVKTDQGLLVTSKGTIVTDKLAAQMRHLHREKIVDMVRIIPRQAQPS
jgi:CheY-like chemotaxis protein